MSFQLLSAKSAARSLAILFSLVLANTSLFAEKATDLKPQGYVNDFAGVLNAPAKENLSALCTEVDQKAQAQIAIVTISSLEGEPIEQFSIELATHWGVGPKQAARGVLILLAPNDHKYRIEVGYGLEPILPDGKVGGFGREAVPLLRQNDYGGALLLITRRVASVIAEDKGVTLGALSGVSPPESESDHIVLSPWNTWILILVFLFLVGFPVLGFILRLLFFGGLAGSYRRRGGWGFGGFGGGSFGGGGASGSW